MRKRDLIGMLAFTMAMSELNRIDELCEACYPELTAKERSPEDYYLSKGLKRFEIDGKVVFALNEKNAIRKAKKL